VQAALDDWRTAPIDPRLRATLGFLEKLTRAPADVGPADVERLRSAGVSDEAIEDAIHVCALFNIYDRLADTLGFDVPSADVFRRQASLLLRRGYQ
jgi:uncharacterized peroxidase-related enzyme